MYRNASLNWLFIPVVPHSKKQTRNTKLRKKIDTLRCMKSDKLLNSSYLDKWVCVSYRNPKMFEAFLTHLF